MTNCNDNVLDFAQKRDEILRAKLDRVVAQVPAAAVMRIIGLPAQVGTMETSADPLNPNL